MKDKRLQSFSEIESYWYTKLSIETDFIDIENTSKSDRPLLEWHSFKFTSAKAQIQKQKAEAYQARLDQFSTSKEFRDIIELMVKHGNSMFGLDEVANIWEMHRAGLDQRSIAHEMDCSKSCIHFLLHRIKAWMNLV